MIATPATQIAIVRWSTGIAAAGLLIICAAAYAASDETHSRFVTLGTNSGPIPNPNRSEPANLVRYGEQGILVDVGDGAAEQLAKAGVSLDDVQTIFISHLHFDHTGGLFAVLSLRYQAMVKGQVTIYGPPGTRRTVESLVAAMRAGVDIMHRPVPEFRVEEIDDGAKVTVGRVAVTAASNSHFSLGQDRPGTARAVSLSYRFDLPDRSIVFTGDTGPSSNVEHLAHGVDLLVSEIMDVDAALAELRRTRPDVPSFVLNFAVQPHFIHEHLTADQVGILAQHAEAKSLVLTHFGGATGGQAQIDRLTKVIGEHFRGPVTFARDLDQF